MILHQKITHPEHGLGLVTKLDESGFHAFFPSLKEFRYFLFEANDIALVNPYGDVFKFHIGQYVWVFATDKLIECMVQNRQLTEFKGGEITLNYTMIDGMGKYYKVDESNAFETVGSWFKANCQLFDLEAKPENIYFYSA